MPSPVPGFIEAAVPVLSAGIVRSPESRRRLRVFAVLALVTLAGCAGSPAAPSAESDSDTDEPAVVEPAPNNADAVAAKQEEEKLPKQDLTPQVLYEYLVAEIAAQRGDFQTATQAYLDITRRTRDPRVARRAVEVARAGGLNDSAMEAAELWLEIEPDSREALGTFAAVTVRAGHPEEAVPQFKRILAIDAARRADTLVQIGRLLATSPNKAAGLKVMQELAAEYPDVAEAHFAVSQTALAAGSAEVALAEVRKAATLRPGWEMAALFEAQILQRKSPTAAIDQLAAFLDRYPQAQDARLGYARLLVGEKRYADARVQFQKLSDANPKDTELIYAVAMLSMQIEDWPRADDYLRRLLALPYHDRNSVRLYLGQVAQERKRYDDALKWYRAVTPGERYLQARIRQAQVLALQGDIDGAQHMLQPTSSNTNSERVQLVLAESQVLRDANRPKDAFAVVEAGLAAVPDDPDLLYERAMIADKLDRADILESSLRKLIALKPDHAHAYNALGYSLADRNVRLPEARSLIEKALSLAPNDPFIVDSMGWVLYRQGDLHGALKELQRAYSERPDPEIAAHLGEVLWKLGRAPEAQKIWSDAAAKSPSNEALEKTVRRFTQ